MPVTLVMDRTGDEHAGGAGSFGRRLAAIALGGLILRLLVRWLHGTADWWRNGYTLFGDLARSLAEGHGYAFPGGTPTAFRVPFYPMLIALTSGGTDGNPWPAIAAQALTSAGTVVCAGLLARRRFGEGAGLLAAGLCAVYPYYVWHDLSLQETGLFTFLAALATVLACAAREGGKWLPVILAGAVLGAAILTRATLLPFAAIVCLWLGFDAGAGRATWGRRSAGAVLALAAMIAVLSPWLLRAHAITGSYGLGTELGAAVFAGNHPLTFADYPDRSIDLSREKVFAAIPANERAELESLGASEAATSEWYLRKGMAHIAEHPGDFVLGALHKLWAAFRPMPSPLHGWLGNLGYAAAWCPLLALGLAGIWRERRKWRRDVPFYAHFVTFSGITAVIWAHSSHRSYLDVYLMVFAAGLLAQLWQRWRRGLRGKALIAA
ncbi:MAG: ArnT family glycosyltransferase [Novosphingobium sp.]